MNLRLTCYAYLAASLLGLASAAGAATLAANESLDDGVLSYQGGSMTGALVGTTRTFSWSGVSGGLDLAGFVLTYTEGVVYRNFSNGKNLVLDLLNGTEYGAITNGGSISTEAEPAGSTGWVTITNAGAISLVELSSRNAYGNSASSSGGIRVNHKGTFRAASATSDAVSGAAAQSYRGDDTGTFTVTGTIDSSNWIPGGGSGGALTILGYTGVDVGGGIKTHSGDYVVFISGGDVTIGSTGNRIGGAIRIAGGIDARGRSSRAGNVTMYGAGAIEVLGAIDLYAIASTEGNLTLDTSGDIKLSALDLTRVAVASLNCGVSCVVTGVVASFSTNHTGGDGAFLNPYVTTQTQLRASAGRKVMYRPELGGNAYLGGASYRVAALDGTAGAGGVLTPYQARGMVVMFR